MKSHPVLLQYVDNVLVEDGLKADPNYNLDSVLQCFAEQRNDSIEDNDIINRIIKAYNLSKSVQKNLGPVFHPSTIWAPLMESTRGWFMGALAYQDAAALKGIFRNFWRDPCSLGLCGLNLDMWSTYFGPEISLENKKAFMNDSIHRHWLWKELMVDGQLSDLKCPLIGNPYGSHIDGQFVITGSHYQHYYSTQINKLVAGIDNPVVMEIGAGFCSMAYYLSRDNSNLTYIDFDLPENVALASYNLIASFPNKRIGLYGEVELNEDALKNYDILLMPSFCITQLPSKSVDLVFNSYSLGEMSSETITFFVSEFQRLVRSYILHVNHEGYSTPLSLHFNPEIFSLIFKGPAAWNLARSPVISEHEYLYLTNF